MILWGPEHKLRATNLANVIGEHVLDIAALGGPGVSPPSTDKTLTIWGHGGPDEFAAMTAKQLSDFIKAWKATNVSLTTVELVTCDSRHSPDNRDSFTDQLMPLLINLAKGNVLVNIKCLPRGGSTATTSVLYASEEAGSNGYYFIAADDDTHLKKGVQVFEDAWAAVPAGTPAGKNYELMFPLAKAVNDKAAMR